MGASMKRTRWWWIVVAIYCIGIIVVSHRALEYDMWFNLKSGEIFSQKGIIGYDVFSHAASGRTWYPSQWLFQLAMYGVTRVGGTALVSWVIAAFTSFVSAVFIVIARRVYKLPWLAVFPIHLVFYAVTFIFYVSRSLSVVYLLFLLTLAIILSFVKRDKNALWALVPVTIIWTNIHGSMFFPGLICGEFAAVTWLEWMLTKKPLLKHKAVTLGVWSFVTLALTILPPVGIAQYKLLYLFWVKRFLVTFYITEWQPLAKSTIELYLYTATAFLAIVGGAIVSYRYKSWHWLLHLVPFVSFVFSPYAAFRNGFFGYSALMFIILETVAFLWPRIKTGEAKLISMFVAGAIILTASGFIVWRHGDAPLTYPTGPVSFLKAHALKGNMYNEFGAGGYLLYQLYPQYKVFFDGRADIYLCCEIPDDLLLNNVMLPQDQYRTIVNSLMDKYHIAFALIGTNTKVVRRDVAITLSQDPSWHLIYLDDYYSLFARDGFGNDDVIAAFGMKWATPFGERPYPEGKQEEARVEYERMMALQDSATVRNALAAYYFESKDVYKAVAYLDRAIAINPQFDATYVALAGIAMSGKDFEGAQELLEKALKINDTRALTYVQLANLSFNAFGDKEKAKKILIASLKKVNDIQNREIILSVLDSLGVPNTQVPQ